MANISRNSFIESKAYDKVILQQGSPLTDYDFNEMQDIQRFKLRRSLKELLGDGAIENGFQVRQQTTPNTTVRVTNGTLYVDGVRLFLPTGVNVQTPAPPTSGSRTEYVYVEMSEQEIDSTQDPDIKHPKLTVEPTRRIKTTITFHVSTTVPNDTATVKRYTLAELTRTAGQANITNAMITDRRGVKLTFEGAGFSVKGSVTMGNADDTVVDIQSRIMNTSNAFNGRVFIDDSLRVSGSVELQNQLTVDQTTRLKSGLFVQGSIQNDTSSNGGDVLVSDNFRVEGTSQLNGATTVNLDGTGLVTPFRITGSGRTTWNFQRLSNNGFAINNGANMFMLNDGGTHRLLGHNVEIGENLTIAKNLTVTGTTTQTGAVTVNNTLTVNNATTVTRNDNANPTLAVRQNGTADIVQFGTTTTPRQAAITRHGGLHLNHNATIGGSLTVDGKITEKGHYYPVATVPLFGIGGDLQFQSSSSSWQDITPALLFLFDLNTARCYLPPVPTGATRHYRLRIAESDTVQPTDSAMTVQLRLCNSDASTTALTWSLPKEDGGLDGERMYVESSLFTVNPNNQHWKIQGRINGGNGQREYTLMYAELIAYDIYN